MRHMLICSDATSVHWPTPPRRPQSMLYPGWFCPMASGITFNTTSTRRWRESNCLAEERLNTRPSGFTDDAYSSGMMIRRLKERRTYSSKGSQNFGGQLVLKKKYFDPAGAVNDPAGHPIIVATKTSYDLNNAVLRNETHPFPQSPLSPLIQGSLDSAIGSKARNSARRLAMRLDRWRFFQVLL